MWLYISHLLIFFLNWAHKFPQALRSLVGTANCPEVFWGSAGARGGGSPQEEDAFWRPGAGARFAGGSPQEDSEGAFWGARLKRRFAGG